MSKRVLSHIYLSLPSGAVELVDCSNRLPGLKRVPGLTSWKVCHCLQKLLQWLEIYSMGRIDLYPL